MTEFSELLKKAKELTETEPDEAMRICNHILNEDMDGMHGQMALFMLGYIMLQAERFGLAYHIYERCAQMRPDISEIWSNMGMCLEDFSPDRAKKAFRIAGEKNPNNANAYANEGLIDLQSNNPEKCIELCDKALKINPELRSAKHNKGLALLMLRKWREGWNLYFETLGVKHRERRDYGIPEWNGEPGTVLVYGEQGVGDEIMFASCLDDLMQTNNVILDCDKRLESLFNRSFDIPVYGTRFCTETPILDNHKPDYQCAIGQLPKFYRNSEESFPGTPYLVPDPDQVIMWRALFDSYKGRKIGIAWRGGIRHTGEKKRSMELFDLEPLLNDQDTFISLEYKDVPKDQLDKYGIKAFPKVTKKGGDIDELAAMISQLDMVITACTTVVYIAGALGIPCFVLVPSEPSYRYHKRGCFPWYKSVQLIRFDGSWAKTAKRAKDAADFHWLRQKRNSSLPRTLSFNPEKIVNSR